MATKKNEEKEIPVVALKLKTIQIPIIGVTPLIVHRFDEKSQKQIEESGKAEIGMKQGGKKKKIADPMEDYEASLYRLHDGSGYGFPAVAFKAAMVDTAYRVYGKKMTDMKAFFHVIADDPVENLVRIEGEPQLHESMVRVGGITKVASPRYRAMFPKWKAKITIRFIQDVITEAELLALLQTAGFSCGVGEWRPQKDGMNGQWLIASE